MRVHLLGIRCAAGLLLSACVLQPATATEPDVAPTPADGCPRRFDQHTTGLPSACLFIGRYNPSCGRDAVAIFAGDGTALVVGLSVSATAPTVYMPAEVLSATEGKLVRWSDDLDLKTEPEVGSVRLASDGKRLHVTLGDNPSLQVGECRFREYVGEFVGMVSADAPADADAGDAPPERSDPLREALERH